MEGITIFHGEGAPVDPVTCEFVASIPEETLCRITAFPPSLDFAEPFYRHAVNCEVCAGKIDSSHRNYGSKLHPELIFPEEEQRLKEKMLALIKKSEEQGPRYKN